jgi:hypothetical protein
MTTDRAAKFVEKLQRSTYERLGRTSEDDRLPPEMLHQIHRSSIESRFPDATVEDRERLLEAVIAHDRESAQCPTAYENRHDYMIMLGLAESIKKAAGTLIKVAPEWPLIATLPSCQVNAMAVRVPGCNEYVIFFESQLTTFTLLLSKVVVQAIPLREVDSAGSYNYSVKREDIIHHIEANEEVRRRFFELVWAYAAFGMPALAPQYILGSSYVELSDLLCESMELFAFGHEYSHIVFGHLDAPEAARQRLLNAPADEIVYSWIQEHLADVLGVRLSCLAMMESRKVDAALSFWGADLFFSALELMDKAVSLLRHGDENVQQLGSHPPSGERRAILRASLPDFLGEENARGAVALGEAVEFASARLWDVTRDHLLAARPPGGGAAPSWR